MNISKNNNKSALIQFLHEKECLAELTEKNGNINLRILAELSNLPIKYIKSKNAKKILNEFKNSGVNKITLSSSTIHTTVNNFVDYVSTTCVNDYKNPAIVLTVLKTIINSLNKKNTDIIDDVFNVKINSYEENMNLIFASKQESTKAKYVKIALKINQYYQSYIANKALPDDFREAIKLVHLNSGMSIRHVERVANIKKDKAKNIVRGIYIPRDKTVILKLEKAYSLPPHTLLNKVGKHSSSSNIGINDIPIEFQNEYSRIRPHLNNLSFDFHTAPYDKKIEICKWITENIIINNNEYSKKSVVNLKNKYRYTKLTESPVLKDEIEKLIQFKESILPEEHYIKESSWCKSTSSKYVNSLLYFYGFIDKYQKNDKIERNDYCLSLLLNKSLVYDFIKFKIERRGKICSDDMQFLIFICSLLRNKFGFICQTEYYSNKTMIAKLCEIEALNGLPSEYENQSGWIQACADARAYYQDLIKQLNSTYKKTNIDRNGHIAMSRDPFKPIEAILDKKEPLKEYLYLLHKAKEKCVSANFNPKQYIVFMSGYLSLSIILQTGLRAKNMRSLQFSEGNFEKSEQLFKNNDKYFIDVPANKVKNFQRNYTEISNTNNLYKDIEEYISIKKSVFSENNNNFIVTINNTNYSESSFSRMIRNFTKLYICYHKFKNEPGIENLQPHGPHSLRDIIATHVIKKTGSFALAAMAIHDSEQTVRKHYARFLPSDKSELIRELTSDIFN